MSFVNPDILRQRYFELSTQCAAAVQRGAEWQQIELIKTEMQQIINHLNQLDGRDPSDLVLE